MATWRHGDMATLRHCVLQAVTREVKRRDGSVLEITVWNKTVANLSLMVPKPVSLMYPIVLPRFRLYEVASLRMCVLPYKYPHAQGSDLS